MLSAGSWRLNQSNTIAFVLVDATGTEVAGLGDTFTVQIAKEGGTLVAGAGSKSEIGAGWYRYRATAAEADTIGPVVVVVTGPGVIQQNLEYVVETRTVSAIPLTYTVTNSLTAAPVEGVYVAIATDPAGGHVVWAGYTDAFGVARDSNGGLPYLDAGTYYLYRQRSGFSFVNPDVEVVS